MSKNKYTYYTTTTIILRLYTQEVNKSIQITIILIVCLFLHEAYNFTTFYIYPLI